MPDLPPSTPPERPRRVMVDVMNVMGSTPDGWWRDRDGAARRLLARLAEFAAREALPLTAVLDGRPLPALPEGEHDGIEVLYALRPGPNAADDRIAALVAADPDPATVLVVTSDRALASRVRGAGARTMGARAFGEWVG